MTTLAHAVAMLARHWPLTSDHAARRQAVRLIRARRYLRERGIEAHAIGSKFAYRSAPQVLA